MAEGMSLPRVIYERTTALWTNALRAYEGKSSELIPPGPRSRESVQQAPVTLELTNTPGKQHKQTKGGTRINHSWRNSCLRQEDIQSEIGSQPTMLVSGARCEAAVQQ